MSNLKKLVVSLELAKKLKKLGCPQESEFYWWKDHCEAHQHLEPDYYLAQEETNPTSSLVN